MLTDAFSAEEIAHVQDSRRGSGPATTAVGQGDQLAEGARRARLHTRRGTDLRPGRGRVDVPSTVFAQAIGMIGPTLIEHGTDAQKDRFLDPILRGELVFCQLFSEPDAGSDLANLKTSVVRDGDNFVVNGQKVWTSNAHYSDWGMLLARTDPDAPRTGESPTSSSTWPARASNPSAAPDHRRRALQRGLPHRRPRSGCEHRRRGQRRSGADDVDAHQRACRYCRRRPCRDRRARSSSCVVRAEAATRSPVSGSLRSTRMWSSWS